MVAEIDAKVGGFGIVPSELDGGIVSSHYFLFEVDESVCLRGWLDAFIRSGRLEEQVIARGSTNYAAIRSNHVLEFDIPLPPLPEQRRIVAQLAKLAAKIEEAKALRKRVAAQMGAVWASKAEAALREIADRDRRPLAELVTVYGGGTPAKTNPSFWEGPIPWISPKDMKQREIRDSIDHISQEATLASPAKLLEPGAILIVVRGMILARTVPVAILRAPAAVNQDMKALFPIRSVAPEYLCTALWALNGGLLGLVERSTHDTRKLQTDKLLAFKIPVPSLPKQAEIVSRLAVLETNVDAASEICSAASAELDSVLTAFLANEFRERRNEISSVHHPLLFELASGAAWSGQDDFPAFPEWADEVERCLQFAQTRGQWGRYLPRLREVKEHRDEALAEIQGAYFLETHAGLPVAEWEPPGANGKRGDYLVKLPDGRDLFVEVKAPGWEGEIAEIQGQASPRLQQPKYLDGDGGATVPWWSVRKAIQKAQKQLPADRPTMVLIADDLQAPLNFRPSQVEIALYQPKGRGSHEGEFDYLAEPGCFADSRFQNVGAVGILNVLLLLGAPSVTYSFRVFHNPKALAAVRVPEGAFRGFSQSSGAVRVPGPTAPAERP